MIDLRKIVLGDPSRLRFIIRFSNCPRIHNESVSDHSFYVALYAYYIAMDLINCRGVFLSLGEVLGKALVHDMDECFSGDFIRMFKHSNSNLKREVAEACKRFMTIHANEITDDQYLCGSLTRHWSESKMGREGKIVAFADFLSVVSYIHQEIDLGNNRMSRQIPELLMFYESFKAEEFEFLDPYVTDVGDILNELKEKQHVGKGI